MVVVVVVVLVVVAVGVVVVVVVGGGGSSLFCISTLLGSNSWDTDWTLGATSCSS